MKYKKLTGIILKKQNYREADQIITVWTRESGKVRVLARALRRPSSKLNFALQDLSEVEVHLVGSNLPTLIGVKPLKQFIGLHQHFKKTAMAFYASELMLKMTADEHPNREAYDSFFNLLKSLNETDQIDNALLDDFCLYLLEVLGFKIPDNLSPLNHSKINKFIEYILERNIKSEVLFNSA